MAIEDGKRQSSQSPLRNSRLKPRTFDSVYDLKDRMQQSQKMKLDAGQDLITKVYPSDVIPDQYVERKRDYRPNNFMSSDLQLVNNSGGLRGSQQKMLKADTS